MSYRDDRPIHLNHHIPGSHPHFAQAPTAQPPAQIPHAYSDPFQAARDHPFIHGGGHNRGESYGVLGRGWPPSQAPGNGNGPLPQQHHPQHPSHASPSGPPLPPPPHNGLGQMPFSFDPSRRRSVGGASSPPQYVAGPLEPPPPPPPFPSRNMPPPSPPQMPPPAASTYLASAPRGPPTSSPFAGVRDLAGFAPHRPGAGMSISSILGGDERKPNGSPRITAAAATATTSSTPKMMRPPSPGRARSSSMREDYGRREPSPTRGGFFGEPRAQSAFHERMANEPRRDIFASPQFQRESPHSFRAFRPDQQEQRAPLNGAGMLGRPNSQPLELQGPRSVDEIIGRREVPGEGRFGTFRHFGEPPRSERTPRHDGHPFPNGLTSQPREREVFGSPQMDRDIRQPPARFQPAVFGNPMREDQAGLFRPAFHPVPDAARESIEGRSLHDTRREEPRSSPPVSEFPLYGRGPSGYGDRPMTFEEHQRMEAMRELQRKESDGSVHRPMLGISPELNRKGRNSPLPQAVQGAQPRHVGPGGDNPGIKSEFGRMFSGLGSGVGSTTPTAGQSVNGTTTPSRLSPVRHIEDGDLVRTAVAGIEDGRTAKGKAGRKNGRRSRDDERLEADDRATPDLLRGLKRTKTNHQNHQGHHHHHHLHSHHHHHHHHEEGAPPGSFNMLRFPSNPGVSQPNPAHHHHHHHATHGHPAHHHHHHTPRAVPPPQRQATSIINTQLLEASSTKPRRHLGSQVYTTELSKPSNANSPLDAKIKFSSRMQPIPLFKEKENSTYTVRVPRYYLTPSQTTEQNDEPSSFEEICRHHQIWGTEVYTDDSDVLAAAVHSGWLKGDLGDSSEALHGLCDNESEAEDAEETLEVPTSLTSRPSKPVRVPPDHDAHITVLILPPLERYPSTMQHYMRSREWAGTPHDGMSFMIQRLDFVDESAENRGRERGMAARKHRIATEEAKRRDAAAGLLMFATGRPGAGAVSVGA